MMTKEDQGGQGARASRSSVMSGTLDGDEEESYFIHCVCMYTFEQHMAKSSL
jgi:hypothetical protein